jgi:predicted  nucleic acid-binding Zn-ribbon protein
MEKKTSIRKGCQRCGGQLITFKEKVLRTCNNCAADALDGFQLMSEGKVKEGFKTVLQGKSIAESRAVKEKINQGLSKNNNKRLEKALNKAAKKNGLTKEQIDAGLQTLKNEKL